MPSEQRPYYQPINSAATAPAAAELQYVCVCRDQSNASCASRAVHQVMMAMHKMATAAMVVAVMMMPAARRLAASSDVLDIYFRVVHAQQVVMMIPAQPRPRRVVAGIVMNGSGRVE